MRTSRHAVHATLVAAATVLYTTTLGWSAPRGAKPDAAAPTPAPRSAAQPRQEDPVVVMSTMGGHRPENSRILFAAWEDGTVLRHSNLHDIDSRMIVAKTTPDVIQTLLDRIDAAGFFDAKFTLGGPPDAVYVYIRARHGEERQSLSWTERISPRQQTDPDSAARTQMWLDTRAAILRVNFESVQWLDDALDHRGMFRGYHPKDPLRPNWATRLR